MHFFQAFGCISNEYVKIIKIHPKDVNISFFMHGN